MLQNDYGEKGVIAMDKQDRKYFINKYLNDVIYKTSTIELKTITYKQVNQILENREISSVMANDVLIVKNIELAYKMLYSDLDREITSDLLKKTHEIVGYGLVKRTGLLRNEGVMIGGSTYLPKVYQTEQQLQFDSILNAIIDDLNISISDGFVIESSLDLFATLCKQQFFHDGNKRTALIFTNYILLKNCNGVITLEDKNKDEFEDLLIAYYEDENKKQEFLQFIYDDLLNDYYFKNKNDFDLDSYYEYRIPFNDVILEKNEKLEDDKAKTIDINKKTT